MVAKKPRIRKSAPTVWEIAEAAQAKEAKPERKRRFMLPGGFIFKPLAPIWRLLKKVLRWLTPRYFINAWREMRQVTWPSRKETWRLTLAVFIFAIVFGTVIYFVDKVLEDIFKKLIIK